MIEIKDDERKKPLIAVSVGPYGAILADGSEYKGDYKLNTEELTQWHSERLAALAETQGDIYACETIPSLDEVKALLTAIKQFKSIKAWITVSCKDAECLNSGDKFT